MRQRAAPSLVMHGDSRRCSAASWLRPALTLLFAIAFLAKAVIPSGFMPEFDAKNRFVTVTWCFEGGHEPREIRIPLDAPAKKPAGSACPYALASIPPLAPVLGGLTAPLEVYALRAFVEYPPAVHTRAAHRAHAPPTGPPASV